jgi:hypothetical protein
VNENLCRLVAEHLNTEESKQERATLAQRVIAVLGTLCLVLLLCIAVAWPTKAFAAPVYQAEVEGVKIVLTDEPCKLSAVENLQRRATWTEKGKTTEGCYGGHPAFPIVLLYFADKTVVVLLIEMFTQVRGA